jgi:hypothetical protein
MKLSEVLFSDKVLTYTADQVAAVASGIRDRGEKVLGQGAFETWKEPLTAGFRLGLFKDTELVGWATFRHVDIHGTTYQELQAIYIVPEHRGSAAVGRFIYGIHALHIGPVVLGIDSRGGFLFVGGEELLKAVEKRPIFDLSLLDIKTGKKMPYNKKDISKPFMTVILEDGIINAAWGVYAGGIDLDDTIEGRREFAISYNLIEGQF